MIFDNKFYLHHEKFSNKSEICKGYMNSEKTTDFKKCLLQEFAQHLLELGEMLFLIARLLNDLELKSRNKNMSEQKNSQSF